MFPKIRRNYSLSLLYTLYRTERKEAMSNQMKSSRRFLVIKPNGNRRSANIFKNDFRANILDCLFGKAKGKRERDFRVEGMWWWWKEACGIRSNCGVASRKWWTVKLRTAARELIRPVPTSPLYTLELTNPTAVNWPEVNSSASVLGMFVS